MQTCTYISAGAEVSSQKKRNVCRIAYTVFTDMLHVSATIIEACIDTIIIIQKEHISQLLKC